MRTRPEARYFILEIMLLVCTGCAVPVLFPVSQFSRPPYPPDVLQKLSGKDADRRLVSKTLGIPKTSKASGKYWFFANSREMIGFIGADLVLSDEEWVAVQFDAADRVIFSEYNNKPTGCLSNGVCLFPGLFGTSPEQTVITAPSVEDAAAKSYRASDGECAVYLLLKPLPWPLKAGPLQYSVDGKTLGLVNDRSYLFLTHAPGDVRVSAYQFTISMKCKAGDALYVSATKARDWSWETGDELVPVDAAEGKAAIDLRRLALPD